MALQECTRPDGVAWLTLDPEGRELTSARLVELSAAVNRAAASPDVLGIVLHGVFGAAQDLLAIRRIRFAQDAEDAARAAAGTLGRLRASPKPVIAFIDRPALGTGFEIALACSAIVVADLPGVVVGLPAVTLGLLPPANGLLRIAGRAGLREALDLGVSGRRVRPGEALALGLVDAVVAPRSGSAEACARALRPACRRRTFAVERLFLEKNPLGRQHLFRRWKRELAERTHGNDLAALRIVDVVARYGARGFDAAADLEARVYGDLVVSENAHRLLELAMTRAALTEEEGLLARGAYVTRLLDAWRTEARRVREEGCAPDVIDEALVRWGFREGPFGAGLGTGSRAPGPSAVPRDEIALRCALAMVNEALRCHHEGDMTDAGEGDVAAVLDANFPGFRGGPFRYVDVIGATEVLRRMRSLEQRFGPRFEPAPLLVGMARTGERFYE